jgi:hypothetical protein
MCRSAFVDRLMRVPHSEISFLTDTTPMMSSVLSAGFSLDDRLGEQRIYLSRAFLVDGVLERRDKWPAKVPHQRPC